MHISLFDLFSIGIGPSSSHTVGPMKAAHKFVSQLLEKNCLTKTARVNIELFGSLSHTGKGHGTDKAVLLGLEGHMPDTIDPEIISPRFEEIIKTQRLQLNQQHTIHFNDEQHLIFHPELLLPAHSNALRFSAIDQAGNLLLAKAYYSIGGGFIQEENQTEIPTYTTPAPLPFTTAEELLHLCHQHKLSISELMLKNELTWYSKDEIDTRIDTIIDVMTNSITQSYHKTGLLPGPLKVKRRARDLYQKLMDHGEPHSHQETRSLDWLNLFAIAVNEANAAGNRIVTAPTNGAAGIIPAVLTYYRRFFPDVTKEKCREFLLTAGAITILYKKGASISGAEVGCQGEVGVASSMAAGALTAVLGGSIEQVENAAEIAMEHHLGMTCDPVAGLVQIPCIERNAMGAVKAVNAASLALLGDGSHYVSLDKVIHTMKQTGHDMMTIYKETSKGGLAVNVVEC